MKTVELQIDDNSFDIFRTLIENLKDGIKEVSEMNKNTMRLFCLTSHPRREISTVEIFSRSTIELWSVYGNSIER